MCLCVHVFNYYYLYVLSAQNLKSLLMLLLWFVYFIKTGLSDEEIFAELREVHKKCTPEVDIVHLPQTPVHFQS